MTIPILWCKIRDYFVQQCVIKRKYCQAWIQYTNPNIQIGTELHFAKCNFITKQPFQKCNLTKLYRLTSVSRLPKTARGHTRIWRTLGQ